MKKLLVLLVTVISLWLFPQAVFASENGITDFWAAGSEEAAAWDTDMGDLPKDAISWWYDADSGNYDLFLPSTAD